MKTKSATEIFPENMWDIFMDMMAERVAIKAADRLSLHLPAPSKAPAPERIRLRGIRALASHLGIGVNKAQNLKNEGTVPYYEDGGLLYFYSDEVDAALRKGGVL